MAISYVGGAAFGASSAIAVSATVTYSPTAGNTVVCYLQTSSSGAAPVTVVDNNGNALTAGAVQQTGVGNISRLFYGVAITGATSYKASWTGIGSVAWLDILEYAGVGSVDSAFSGTNSTVSTGTTVTWTARINANNAWLIACFGDSAATSWTATNGNLRVNQIAGAPSGQRTACMDNTAALAGLVTCSATKSVNAAWSVVAIALNPSGVSDIRELMLLGVGI